MTERDALRSAAQQAMERAYAPYSGFRVGAALLAADGRTFVGCNVENAAYGEAICAERGAVMSAVANGAREFRRMEIVSDAHDPAPPCGSCRQVLAEFAPELPVTSTTLRGATRQWTMDQLLPARFDPHFLAERDTDGG